MAETFEEDGVGEMVIREGDRRKVRVEEIDEYRYVGVII